MKNLRIKQSPPTSHEDFEMFLYNCTEDAKKYFNHEVYKWDFCTYRQGYCDFTKRFTPEEFDALPQDKVRKQYMFYRYKTDISRVVFGKLDFAKLADMHIKSGFGKADVVKEYVKVKNTIYL